MNSPLVRLGDCRLTPTQREKYAMLFAMGVIPERCGKSYGDPTSIKGCVLPEGHDGPCGHCRGNGNKECLDRVFGGYALSSARAPWCY